MNGLIVRWFVLTCAILVTSSIFDGIHADGLFPAFLAAVMLGIFNAVLRPLLFIITLPINILSLGFFTFVINALMLKMAGMIDGFEVHGFWTAVFGSITISIVSFFLNAFINDSGRVSYIDLRKKDKGRWE